LQKAKLSIHDSAKLIRKMVLHDEEEFKKEQSAKPTEERLKYDPRKHTATKDFYPMVMLPKDDARKSALHVQNKLSSMFAQQFLSDDIWANKGQQSSEHVVYAFALTWENPNDDGDIQDKFRILLVNKAALQDINRMEIDKPIIDADSRAQNYFRGRLCHLQTLAQMLGYNDLDHDESPQRVSKRDFSTPESQLEAHQSPRSSGTLLQVSTVANRIDRLMAIKHEIQNSLYEEPATEAAATWEAFGPAENSLGSPSLRHCASAGVDPEHFDQKHVVRNYPTKNEDGSQKFSESELHRLENGLYPVIGEMYLSIPQ
jgi:hypothetical protein